MSTIIRILYNQKIKEPSYVQERANMKADVLKILKPKRIKWFTLEHDPERVKRLFQQALKKEKKNG